MSEEPFVHMLNDSQIATFKEEGYLIIEDLFTEGDLRPVEGRVQCCCRSASTTTLSSRAGEWFVRK